MRGPIVIQGISIIILEIKQFFEGFPILKKSWNCQHCIGWVKIFVFRKWARKIDSPWGPLSRTWIKFGGHMYHTQIYMIFCWKLSTRGSEWSRGEKQRSKRGWEMHIDHHSSPLSPKSSQPSRKKHPSRPTGQPRCLSITLAPPWRSVGARKSSQPSFRYSKPQFIPAEPLFPHLTTPPPPPIFNSNYHSSHACHQGLHHKKCLQENLAQCFCFPSTKAADLMEKCSLFAKYPSTRNIIIHAGYNNIPKQGSEILKQAHRSVWNA